MLSETLRGTMRAARWIAAGLVILLLGYATAGLVGGSIPVNGGWVQARTGVRVLIEDNGIHTGLVMPVRAAGVDWSGVFPARDIADPRYAAFDHVAVGWGDRAFYVETPTWADFSPHTALRAIVGSSRVVLHVEHIAAPAIGANVRAIILTPDEYRRLADFVRGSLGPGGKVANGYDADDAFYDATGRYSAIVSCNEWTGHALRHAGIRVGAWTPFPVTVMSWFPPPPR